MRIPAFASSMDRHRAGGVLAGIGLLLAIFSIRFGDPSSELGLGLPGFLLGAGVALGVLGVATIVRPPTAARDAVAVSIVTLAVVFAVSTAVVYSDLVASTPGDWIPQNLSRAVAIQAAITIGLAPVPAGYVAGVLDAKGHPSTGFRALVSSTIVAWVVPGVLMVALELSGLVQGLLMLLVIGALGIGLVPRRLMRQVTRAELRR